MAERSVVVPGPVRCAIYTRKSSEEGLEQEFNSLHAQREAAEAFLASQRQEGWLALPYKYDDGGFTGGNLERPALRKLLTDIEAGCIDAVVVYKVDRLSRSLLDFARLMALFEKHGVTFVSVTQQFNTSTPVGRLTLHILLSFAEFERDIIRERTRDKKAAAKRKGKWTGGYIPLGYDLDPRGGRLVVNEEEAAQVRAIFALFISTRSVEHALAEVQKRGWKSKSWVTEKQKRYGGRPFTAISLRRLLANPLYAGLVCYRGQSYRGEHRRIVELRLWRRVQQLLRCCAAPRPGKHNKHGALLYGVLHCGRCGKSMLHTCTTRRTRMYRYYVCRTKGCVGQSVAAQAFEESVVAQLRTAMPKPSGDLISTLAFVEQITYDPTNGQVSVRLQRNRKTRMSKKVEEVCYRWEQTRRSRSSAGSQPRRAPLPRIARLMALALSLDAKLRNRSELDVGALARMGSISRTRLTQILNLLHLAPDIQERLLNLPSAARGREPITESSIRQVAGDYDWQRQRERFERIVACRADRRNAK